MKSCQFRKQDGSRCGAPAMKGAGLCISHNPAATELKSAAVRKGGRNRRTCAPGKPLAIGNVSSLEDLTQLMFSAVVAVNSGEIELDRARTIGYLAGITAKLVETNQQGKQLDEIEARLVRLIEQREETER